MNEAPAPEQNRARWLRLGVLALICLPLVGLGQFVMHCRPDEMDSYLFATYGRELLNGARLYTDLWDIKPPVIFWLNAAALALSGGSLVGVWVLCGMAQVGSLACLNRGCQKCYGTSAAFLTTVIAAVHMPFWVFQVGENRPATFFTLTELAAFAVFARWLRRSRRNGTPLIAVGVLCGLSFCLKQTVLAFAVTVVAYQLVAFLRSDPAERRAIARQLACFVAGWCGTVALVVLVLAINGSLGWAVDAIILQPTRHANLRGRSVPLPPVDWYADYAKPFALPLVLVVAVIAREVSRFLFRPRPSNIAVEKQSDLPHAWTPFVILWLLVALGLASIGVAARPWYLALAMPPLFVLCADGINSLLAFTHRFDDTKPAFPMIVATVWIAWMLIPPLRSQIDMTHRRYYQRFEAEPDQYTERIIELIETHTHARDPIFLNGYRPDIYWRTGRPCSSRYYGTLFSGSIGNDDLINRQLIESLRSAPPRFMKTGPVNRETSLGQEFEHWLETHYRPLDDARVKNTWLRKDVQ